MVDIARHMQMDMGWDVIGLTLALVLLIAFLWPHMGKRRGAQWNLDSAEKIARRRYAAGEIDRETYQEIIGDLRGHTVKETDDAKRTE